MVRKGMYLLHRYAGLGDALFVNTIAYYLGREIGRIVLIGTNHHQLFKGNPWARLLPIRTKKWGFRLARLLKALGIVSRDFYMDYGERLDEHILAVLARKVGLQVVPTKPVLFLSDNERRNCALPPTSKSWIAIQSAGNTTWTPNKEWYPERFAKVSEMLQERFAIVQLGLSYDPPLPCDIDLRGKISPREAAAVLASCVAFIGQVGYLMHAAAAVGTPAVIVYGGFEAPWQSGYPWNENLFTKLPCSPCWMKNPCPYGRMCMDQISVQDVLMALERLLSKERVHYA